MSKPLTCEQRIERIHARLAWSTGSSFRQLAWELHVPVERVHEDIGIMRKMLGLPISLERYPQIYYTHCPQLNSDVFDLADKLACYIPED